MNENVPYSIKDELHCPACKAPINTAAGVTPGHSNTIHKSQIIVCSYCAAPGIVGDSGLEPLTKERFEGLDPRTQQAVRVSVEQIRRITAQSAEGN